MPIEENDIKDMFAELQKERDPDKQQCRECPIEHLCIGDCDKVRNI